MHRHQACYLQCLALTAILLSTQARHISTHSSLNRQTTVRAFSQNEFLANYIRLTQYKRGQVPDCPRRIEITAMPTEHDRSLIANHTDMRIGVTNFTAEPCTDDGHMRLVRSDRLVGPELATLKDRIQGDLYSNILFDNLTVSLAGRRYYVSVDDTPRMCGQLWFTNRETFIFFDESDVIDLTVVLKVEDGIPKLLMVPLTGNIRYMISVTEGSTCIYRVDVDVSNLINNITRPSDSPSPTPSFSASQTPSEAPTPAASPTTTPTAAESPSVTPLPSPSQAQSTTPTPTASSPPSSSPSASTSSSPSQQPTPSNSPPPSVAPPQTTSPSPSYSPSPTLTSSPTPSYTPQETPLPTRSSTPSPSATVSQTVTVTPSVSPARTPSPVSSPTNSPIPVSKTPQPSRQVSPTPTTSPSMTSSGSPSPSVSMQYTPSSSLPPSATPETPTISQTPAMGPFSVSPSPTNSSSPSSLPSSLPTSPMETPTTSPLPSSSSSSSPGVSSSPSPVASVQLATVSPTPQSLAPETPVAITTPSTEALPTISASPTLVLPLLTVRPSVSPRPMASDSALPSFSEVPSTTASAPSSTPSVTWTPSMTPSKTAGFEDSSSNNQLGGGGEDRNNTDLVDGLSTCFPADATVTLYNGASVPMHKLVVGDRVLVADGSYSEVLLFTHASASARSWFVHVKTHGGHSLRLTRGHYIPVNGLFMRADAVKVGDMVLVAARKGVGHVITSDTVVDVSVTLGRGLYNPQTVRGDIVVDGVVASCYTEAIEPTVAHSLLAPLRGLAASHGLRPMLSVIATLVTNVAKQVTG